MFETVSLIVKYIFVLIVYLFIFGIIRLIYLDIKSIGSSGGKLSPKFPYLKLLNRRESLNFKIEEAYSLDRNLAVGRSGDNDIMLNDPFVSKRHARFEAKDGKIFLEDLDSSNGTFLNGDRLANNKPVCLTYGDKVKIGNIEFLFMKSAG